MGCKGGVPRESTSWDWRFQMPTNMIITSHKYNLYLNNTPKQMKHQTHLNCGWRMQASHWPSQRSPRPENTFIYTQKIQSGTSGISFTSKITINDSDCKDTDVRECTPSERLTDCRQRRLELEDEWISTLQEEQHEMMKLILMLHCLKQLLMTTRFLLSFFLKKSYYM